MQPEPGRVYWTVPIDQCDVEDKETLRIYRRKYAEWIDILTGDDDHAVTRQIHLMNWSYISFRVFNEALRIVCKRDLASPVRNRPLFEFATTGFVATQVLAIRRLNESQEKNTDPKRKIVSLRRVVEDIYTHRRLLTREIFVGFDGAPYDPEPSRQRALAAMAQRIDAGDGGPWTGKYQTAGPDAWPYAERLHKKFDRLSGVGPLRRARTDSIIDKVLKSLKSRIDDPAIEKARELANKRIAHAAEAASRSLANYPIHGISFNDIDSAHRNLITVTEFISSFLLNDASSGAVPFPQFNAFEHLDAGGLDEHAIAKLSRLARVLAQRRERWVSDAAGVVLQSCR